MVQAPSPEVRAALASAQLRRAALGGALSEATAREQASLHRRRPPSPDLAQRQASIADERTKKHSRHPARRTAWPLGYEPERTRIPEWMAPAPPWPAAATMPLG